jgi:hypothetical protein
MQRLWKVGFRESYYWKYRESNFEESVQQFFLIGIVGVGVQLGPLGTADTNRPTVPAPDDYDDGQIGRIIGKGNRSTRRKPSPMPLCPPQTPHAVRKRTRAVAVGSQRLTAWATARPVQQFSCWCKATDRRTDRQILYEHKASFYLPFIKNT